MPSIQSYNMECTVVISRFESFNKFYVQKVEDDECSSANVKSNKRSTSVFADKSKGSTQRPPVGSIIETLTDKADGVWYKAEVMASHDGSDIIVRVLNDGSVCKSTKIKYLPGDSEKSVYLCCLEDSEEDDLTNDPFYLSIISNIMTSREWTMKTSSVREPYRVSLSIDGEDCFDVVSKFLPTPDAGDTANSSLSPSADGPENSDALVVEEKPENDTAKKNGPENNGALTMGENPKNDAAEKNGTENEPVVPQSEMVTIRNFETVKSFQARSECLYTLYMERINAELKTCATRKRALKKNRVGSIAVGFSNSLDDCYRVLVESVTSHGTNCYLLDYGEYDVFREFYKPTRFLLTCPPIVRRCSLYAPSLAGKEDEIWFRDVDDVFEDIATIDGIRFEMTVRDGGGGGGGRHGPPCAVSLMLDNVDIGEMLCPVNVRVTRVRSLTDFRVTATADGEQRAAAEPPEPSGNVPRVFAANPVPGGLYLARRHSKLARVRFESLGGVKYVVNDVDDTLDDFSVSELYELPDHLVHVPPSAMACSLILDDREDAYSLDAFRRLADERVVFVMSIINETGSGTKPNLVRLYYAHRDVVDILKL